MGNSTGYSVRDYTYNCLYTNVRRLETKISQLDYLVVNEDIDMVFITETWWKEDYPWNSVIPGYKLTRKDRERQIGVVFALYD